MVKEEAETEVDVPLEEAWNWLKDLKNIVSIIPRVKMVEMRGEREAVVKGDFWEWFLPDQLIEGVANHEINESEKYTRTLTKTGIAKTRTFLKCESISEGKTKVIMKADIKLKGTAGAILEKLTLSNPLSGLALKRYLTRELDDLSVIMPAKLGELWKEELEEKTKELESFVYTVSHDLRTPLVSLEGFSNLLMEEYGGELGEEGKHYLDRIQANVIKMDDFIEDLLQLSRIGRKEPPKVDVGIENVVKDVTDELSPKIEEKGIEVVVGEDLPTFHFEEKRLYQIFSNLISNACKYIGDEGENLIEVDAEDRNGGWLLWVKDTGIGIEPEYQEKIFEIFQQAEGADEESTGVGLSIVKRIVETHGGRIWVESEKGKGSTFYMEFPKEEVQE